MDSSWDRLCTSIITEIPFSRKMLMCCWNFGICPPVAKSSQIAVRGTGTRPPGRLSAYSKSSLNRVPNIRLAKGCSAGFTGLVRTNSTVLRLTRSVNSSCFGIAMICWIPSVSTPFTAENNMLWMQAFVLEALLLY